MATITGPKYTGPTTFDLADVTDDLIDLPPGAMKGARAEQEGIDGVIKELADAMPAYGDAAEISPVVYQRFVARTEKLQRLRAHEIALAKALEVCTETRTAIENAREDDISAIAKAVQGAAQRAKSPNIAAPFEKTIAYNSQIAERAAQTRKKKAEAKPPAPNTPGEPTGGGTPA